MEMSLASQSYHFNQNLGLVGWTVAIWSKGVYFQSIAIVRLDDLLRLLPKNLLWETYLHSGVSLRHLVAWWYVFSLLVKPQNLSGSQSCNLSGCREQGFFLITCHCHQPLVSQPGLRKNNIKPNPKFERFLSKSSAFQFQ